MSVRSWFFIWMGCVTLAGCTQEQKKVVATVAPKAPVLIDPFKFHKMIEVAPGQYYDILTRGQGRD
ncbi:hypothetical protein HK413_06985 [Mucilaginibacter sp. S1162]|uniref:Uncharacterized protein n=1 Tax=Mucilaginibacter humi TaxID=2732510 RepID=A0ABX1W6H5_9SPHI|nr:hypothetical protein [Mucilaginibacter humi]NNU33960.1 hypothetical protein [Mucilaginibacter humi]